MTRTRFCEDKFWKKFKASAMYVQDPDLKLRLQTCVNSLSDSFSTETYIMILVKKTIFDIYIVLMKLLNEICKM